MTTSSIDIRKLYYSINNFKDNHQIIYQVKVNSILGVKLIGWWFARMSWTSLNRHWMECPCNQNLQFRVGYLMVLPGSLNKEGFNIRSARYDRSKARIGIIGNNENGCRCADSRLGFGTGGSPTNELACTRSLFKLLKWTELHFNENFNF